MDRYWFTSRAFRQLVITVCDLGAALDRAPKQSFHASARNLISTCEGCHFWQTGCLYSLGRPSWCSSTCFLRALGTRESPHDYPCGCKLLQSACQHDRTGIAYCRHMDETRPCAQLTIFQDQYQPIFDDLIPGIEDLFCNSNAPASDS